MPTSAARLLREDDQQDMSREAVLLQWERKIEAAERLPDGAERLALAAEPAPPTEDSTHEGVRRFERRTPVQPAAEPAASPVAAPAPAEPGRLPERRTITITGRPTPARRRPSALQAQIAQPDRIALWAFLLGLFLVAVAAGTAHA